MAQAVSRERKAAKCRPKATRGKPSRSRARRRGQDSQANVRSTTRLWAAGRSPARPRTAGAGEAIVRPAAAARKTVANHTSSIFAKLQVADQAPALIRAREAGLGP